MQISNKDRAELERLEQELWMEETRFNRKYMEQIMADDFIEFGRSGRTYSKEDSLSHEREPINAIFPLQNLNIRLLTQDTAQVTYNSEVTYDDIIEKGRRSSIWTRSGKGWVLRFHQGTPFG